MGKLNFSTTYPKKIYCKDNKFYYTYEVKEGQLDTSPSSEESSLLEGYYYVGAVLDSNTPFTYNNIVKALIREYVTEDEEFNIINSYNAYHLGINDDISDYNTYIKLVNDIKSDVAKTLGITFQEKEISNEPRQLDLFKFITMTINNSNITDQQALSIKTLYPEWSTFIGETIQKDTKVKYENKLFKVVQTHLVQEQYPPSVDTASLYTEIVEDHKGTKEDPIPYPADGNMVIYNGKYYIEDNILYKCIRDSGNPLYTQLKNVVGNYVEVV